MGGLGVGYIVIIQNAALLFEWWWRFSDGSYSLWKKVVCSNHGISPEKRLQSLGNANGSGLWGQITDSSSFGSEVIDVVQQGFRRRVGEGKQAWFWTDLWVGDV